MADEPTLKALSDASDFSAASDASDFSAASRVMGPEEFVNVKIKTPFIDGDDLDVVPCAFTIGVGSQPFTFVGTLPELGHTFRAFARACDSLEKELKDDIFVERVFEDSPTN